MKKNVAVSTIRHNAMNTHTVVPDVRSDVVNTSTIVSDIHHDTLKIPGNTRGQCQTVSTIRTLPVTE